MNAMVHILRCPGGGPGHMLLYQVPAAFSFIDDMPRTPSMKPKLVDVRALFEPGAPGR